MELFFLVFIVRIILLILCIVAKTTIKPKEEFFIDLFFESLVIAIFSLILLVEEKHAFLVASVVVPIWAAARLIKRQKEIRQKHKSDLFNTFINNKNFI